jgi:hypothetical protein
MFRLFEALKEEGEDALRRTVWLFCAATLILLAVGFTGASLALFIAGPAGSSLAVGLLVSGGVIAVLAVIAFFFSEHEATKAASAPRQPNLNALSGGAYIDRATQALLLRKVESKPAMMLAIAAAAGIAIAALDAFDD